MVNKQQLLFSFYELLRTLRRSERLGEAGGRSPRTSRRFLGLMLRAIHKGHNLRTRAVHIRAERGVAGAHGNALRHGPCHGGGIVGIRRNICKAAVADRRGTRRAVEECHGLRTGADSIRGKGGCAGAAGDTLLHGPQNRVVVVTTGLDIRKRIAAGGLGSARLPPEECHHLRTGAGNIRAKGGGAGAVGNALGHGPLHSVGIVGIGG